MRKYYSAAGIQATDPRTRVKSTQIHWSMLEAYLSGLPVDWRPQHREALVLAVKKQDISKLLEVSKDIESYLSMYDKKDNISTVRYDRQTVSFLKKFPFPKRLSPFDTRAKAIDTWLNSECQCESTNARLRECSSEQLPKFVWRAKNLIFSVLGDLTSDKLLSILDAGTHGPGSTLSSNGNRTTEYYKYLDLPYTVTDSAKPYAFAAISRSPRWIDYLESTGRRREIPPYHGSPAYRELQILNECVRVQNSDKVTFVPKDVKTDRPIAVGSSLNIFLQLGVKSYMEKRLKLFGVDLTNQSKNQEMAYAGSRYCFVDGVFNENQYSTIDLASASDTISYELVKLLLPSDWFAFLDDLRHKSGSLDGETFVYEKFSAMGNGFTFPLESLLFWAIAKSAIEVEGFVCSNNDISVYGDDIIVRFKHHQSVLQALTWSGFTVNADKSFISGAFKESCGSDYFRGHNVRPFYLKREVKTYADIYFVLNSISNISRTTGFCPGLKSLYDFCLSLVPKAARRFAPLSIPTEAGIMVPFSFLSDIGLRPYLKKSESQHLRSRRLLRQDDSYLQSTYWISTEVVAIPYKGIGTLRLYTALRGMDRTSLPSKYTLYEDLLHIESARQGIVTRRKATRFVTRVRPVLSWDGDYTTRETSFHPIYWV
nr:MAG: hypothetical protein 3 [Leviviridae sp.]